MSRRAPLNRYRVSGVRNDTNAPYAMVIRAASAEDAWFIAEQRAKRETVRMKFGKPAPGGGYLDPYTVDVPLFRWDRIEAVR
jgi:hypothetical protein